MNEEVTLAIEEIRQRPADRSWFIPVKLSQCDIPEIEIGAGATLRDIQSVDLYRDWDDGIDRIIDVVDPLPRHLKFLIDSLSSPLAEDRIHAAEALYDKADPRALRPLLKAMGNRSNSMVGYWAAQALGKIRDPRAVPVLINALVIGSAPYYKVIEVLERFETREAQEVVSSYHTMDQVSFLQWLLNKYGDPAT